MSEEEKAKLRNILIAAESWLVQIKQNPFTSELAVKREAVVDAIAEAAKD